MKPSEIEVGRTYIRRSVVGGFEGRAHRDRVLAIGPEHMPEEARSKSEPGDLGVLFERVVRPGLTEERNSSLRVFVASVVKALN